MNDAKFEEDESTDSQVVPHVEVSIFDPDDEHGSLRRANKIVGFLAGHNVRRESLDVRGIHPERTQRLVGVRLRVPVGPFGSPPVTKRVAAAIAAGLLTEVGLQPTYPPRDEFLTDTVLRVREDVNELTQNIAMFRSQLGQPRNLMPLTQHDGECSSLVTWRRRVVGDEANGPCTSGDEPSTSPNGSTDPKPERPPMGNLAATGATDIPPVLTDGALALSLGQPQGLSAVEEPAVEDSAASPVATQEVWIPGPEIPITAEALLALDIPDPEFIVDELLTPGLTIMAGKPKTGKSWLAYSLAVDVAVGRPVLGHFPSVPTGVLYLTLEDTAQRARSRLLTVLGTEPPPSNLLVQRKLS